MSSRTVDVSAVRRAGIVLALLVAFSAPAHAVVIYDESVVGDLPGGPGAAGNVGALPVGTSQVVGTLVYGGTNDQDSFVFTVPLGTVLTGVKLSYGGAGLSAATVIQQGFRLYDDPLIVIFPFSSITAQVNGAGATTPPSGSVVFPGPMSADVYALRSILPVLTNAPATPMTFSYTWEFEVATTPGPDSDNDGASDAWDNCTLVANANQLDADGDDFGNLCDADLNNSGLTTATDFNLLRSVLNQASVSGPLAAAADMNGSGLVTATDFNLLRARLNIAPGPSGIVARPHTLTVATAGTGSGSVASAPAGINCGADCSESYPYRTSVTLNAAASGASTFAGWSGACTDVGTCFVSMTDARSVTATFNAPVYQLDVAVTDAQGLDQAHVTGNVGGIDCYESHGICSATVPAGTAVTLHLIFGASYLFNGWLGACTAQGTTCNLTINANTTTTGLTKCNGPCL
jgi:hypothetical protein